MTGKTQSYARCLNNRLVIRELRRENCSATMLSQRLKLSNAALSAIVDELRRGGFIKEVEVENGFSGLGRRPVYYSINEKFGCVIVISLMDYVVKLVVSDMKENIVYSQETRVERYDVAMIYELVLSVKNLLSEEPFRNMPLLGIELSVPGRVNTQTGELQLSPQFDKDLFGEKNHIVNIFAKQFRVPVVMTNDINLAGLGEMHCGLLQGVQNGILVHVDEGIGGALILNGSLYAGSHGFAGEIGLMRAELGGKIEALDEFISLRVIKKRLGERYGKKMHTADVVELYRTSEKDREYINSTAQCLGKLLKDIVELLDVPVIVLSGRVTLFGEEYIAAIDQEVKRSFNNAEVFASTLGSEASIIGAVSKAVEQLTDARFES